MRAVCASRVRCLVFNIQVQSHRAARCWVSGLLLFPLSIIVVRATCTVCIAGYNRCFSPRYSSPVPQNFLEAPNGYFTKPLLHPGGGFSSETATKRLKPLGKWGSETATNYGLRPPVRHININMPCPLFLRPEHPLARAYQQYYISTSCFCTALHAVRYCVKCMLLLLYCVIVHVFANFCYVTVLYVRVTCGTGTYKYSITCVRLAWCVLRVTIHLRSTQLK